MKMRVIRDHLGDKGMVLSGSVIDVTDGRARELESKKLAVRAIPPKLAKGAASEGAQRPTPTPPTGGPTGAATSQSLSPPAPAQPTRTSRSRRGKRG